MALHPLLTRQIKRLLQDQADPQQLQALFEDISEVYYHNERGQTLLERALDLTSDELLTRNQDMSRELNGLKDAQEQMEQLLTLFNSTMDSSTDGILLMDAVGEPIIFNDRAPEFLDTDNEVLSCINYDGLMTLVQSKVKDASLFIDQFEQIWADPTLETRCTLEFRSGRVIDCCSRPYQEGDDLTGRVWNFHDITELTEREREARFQSLHDPLTKLPNRLLLSDRLSHALMRSQRKSELIALLFIDLDGFKYVNDTLGHLVGDELLKTVAERLQQVVRGNDTIGRQGGDEFLVLLEEIHSKEEVCMVADRILEVLQKPFYCDNQDICISASIGITMHPGDAADTDTLIRNADMAMYQAKRSGRNNYQFFMPDLIDKSSKQLTLQSKLNQALNDGEFSLVYQPKYCLKDRRIIGAEALLRWTCAGGESIPPGDFIPVAEQSGLIIPISEWVIAEACQQLRLWQQAGLEDFNLSINISGLHFRRGHLIESLQTQISLNQLKPQQLELEVTESAIIQDIENSADKLQKLQDYGIKISIDDFGTGYSSFNYLKSLPIDTVKIDKSFIQEIDSSERDAELVKSIIDISHTLGLNVIAEGVETDSICQVLTQHQCDIAQGFLFSHPVPASEIQQMVLSQALEFMS